MSRQTWVTRNVIGSTEVRSSSGCGSCLWFLLGAFLVVGSAAWASDGLLPVVVAALMCAIEAVVGIAARRQYSKQR